MHLCLLRSETRLIAVNVFAGMTKIWYFIAITLIGLSLLPEAASFLISIYRGRCPTYYTHHWWSRLLGHAYGYKEWIISLTFGFVALPLDAVVRLSPNERCERVRLVPKPEDVESGFAFAVDRVRDNLGTLPSSTVVACAVHPMFARAVRLPLISMDHTLCKCCWILPKTASVIVLPFLGPDCWRWSLPWLPLTGSSVQTAHSQKIPVVLTHQDHLPLYGKISLKCIQARLVTILFSGYLGGWVYLGNILPSI